MTNNINQTNYLEEIKAFIGEEKKIKLQSGKEVIIKPLIWKKELKLIKLIGEFLPELEINNTTFDKSQNFLYILLNKAPDVLTEMCSILTDLPIETIENDFVLEDIIEVCLPFLKIFLKRLFNILSTKIQPLLQEIIPTQI